MYYLFIYNIFSANTLTEGLVQHEKNAIEMVRYIEHHKLPVLTSNIAAFQNDDQTRATTNPAESWNRSMQRYCQTNRNSSMYILMEKIVSFLTEQSVQTSLGYQNKGKYVLKKQVAQSRIEKWDSLLSDTAKAFVQNILNREAMVSSVGQLFEHHLNVLCGISDSEAKSYELIASNILATSSSVNVVSIEDEETLPICNVYDSHSDITKPCWWTVRSNDKLWSQLRCSCKV
jgi:hypothetical protein